MPAAPAWTAPHDAKISAPDLSVVIPTRNAARTLRQCLHAVRAAELDVEMLVVDNHSSDATARVATEAGARVLRCGPERSAQRNAGLAAARASAIVFLDADQIVTRGVLEEAHGLLAAGADAVILTERTVGEGYWAAVRALERSCYVGDDDIEAARAFRADLARALGGYDEALTAFEDWDLTARARAADARIARTTAHVLHEEARVGLWDHLRKKAYYGTWEDRYRRKHPGLSERQLSSGRRMRILLRHAPRLARQPHLAVGVIALKALELAATRLSRH